MHDHGIPAQNQKQALKRKKRYRHSKCRNTHTHRDTQRHRHTHTHTRTRIHMQAHLYDHMILRLHSYYTKNILYYYLMEAGDDCASARLTLRRTLSGKATISQTARAGRPDATLVFHCRQGRCRRFSSATSGRCSWNRCPWNASSILL